MTYKNIKEGIFLSRPNRFIAEVEIDGEVKVCHVKNTGRCRELLIKGVRVLLDRSDNPNRRTEYDLVAVYKGDMLINIDSQAPNAVFGEWLKEGGLGNVKLIKPECFYKNSRFDFYVETEDKRIFIEVKGVTLEEDGVAMFPDAPTERGVKHLTELSEAVKDGYEAYVYFVVQMNECRYFTPNKKMHPEFAETLKMASDRGVNVRAVKCKVTEDGLKINGDVDAVIQ